MIRVSEQRSLSGSAAVSEEVSSRGLNGSTTHVDASVDASRDAGSIPAASTADCIAVSNRQDRSRRDTNRVVTGLFFFFGVL